MNFIEALKTADEKRRDLIIHKINSNIYITINPISGELKVWYQTKHPELVTTPSYLMSWELFHESVSWEVLPITQEFIHVR